MACAQNKVAILDGEWCADAGKYGAYCNHTFIDYPRELSKQQWDAERFGMVCTTAENFSEWKKTLMKLCLRANCSAEAQKQINLAAEMLDKIAEVPVGICPGCKKPSSENWYLYVKP